MKIRQGFVSNSSSSSFIINSPTPLETEEQIEDLFFDKDEETYNGPYDSFSKKSVVKFLHGEISKESTKIEVLDNLCSNIEIRGEWDTDYKTGWNRTLRLDRKNFILKPGYYGWLNYLKRVQGKKKYQKIIDKLIHPYIFSIEDHTDIGASLENDDSFWRKVLVEKINQH